MRKLLTVAFPVLALAAIAFAAIAPSDDTPRGALADDVPGYGGRVGDSPPPFQVLDVTGPSQGETLCYRCQYGLSPVICIFARETSEPLAKLAKGVDAAIAKDERLKGFVVVLTPDAAGMSARLKDLAKGEGLKNIPLTIGEDASGPSGYGIAPTADVTVMLWNDGKVKSKLTFAKGQFDESAAQAILADMPKNLKN